MHETPSMTFIFGAESDAKETALYNLEMLFRTTSLIGRNPKK